MLRTCLYGCAQHSHLSGRAWLEKRLWPQISRQGRCFGYALQVLILLRAWPRVGSDPDRTVTHHRELSWHGKTLVYQHAGRLCGLTPQALVRGQLHEMFSHGYSKGLVVEGF